MSPPNGIKSVTVLLVEDDDFDAKLFVRGFQKAKIANPVRRVVDGVEALEVLHGTNGKQKIQAPFVLVVDLNMPRMNGIQLIKAIRADPALRRSIIFVLTTSKSEEDKVASYDLNVAGVIVKDTAGQDFMNVMTLFDTYWHVVELP